MKREDMLKLREILKPKPRKLRPKDYVTTKRKFTESARIESIKSCIEQLQPKASFHRILLCCREMYCIGDGANMDLFSDLHYLLEEGIIYKKYEIKFNEKRKRTEKVFYYFLS